MIVSICKGSCPDRPNIATDNSEPSRRVPGKWGLKGYILFLSLLSNTSLPQHMNNNLSLTWPSCLKWRSLRSAMVEDSYTRPLGTIPDGTWCMPRLWIHLFAIKLDSRTTIIPRISMLKAWNKGYLWQIWQGVKANIMNNGIYWQCRSRIQPHRFECAGSINEPWTP